MNFIDSISYKSHLADNPVGEKIIFACAPLVLSLVFSSYILNTVIICFMAFSSVYLGKISIAKYAKMLSVPVGFITIGIIPIVINILGENTQSIIISVKILNSNIGITKETLMLGINIAFKAWACVSCFYFLTLNTPMNNLFSFLQKHKVSQMLIDLMELIYRFVFLIWNESQRIYTAQMARLGYRDFKTSIKSLAELIKMIFERSLARVERVNMSLESRCFSGKFSYLLEEETSYKSIVPYAVIFNIVLVAIIVLERVNVL